jgi:hypothetical protein
MGHRSADWAYIHGVNRKTPRLGHLCAKTGPMTGSVPTCYRVNVGNRDGGEGKSGRAKRPLRLGSWHRGDRRRKRYGGMEAKISFRFRVSRLPPACTRLETSHSVSEQRRWWLKHASALQVSAYTVGYLHACGEEMAHSVDAYKTCQGRCQDRGARTASSPLRSREPRRPSPLSL